MIEPLDSVSDNSIKELHFLWPPGSGKTTAIEGAIQWRVVCAPSNILLVGQKDDSAELWAETRLHPSFKKSEAMRPFMPENRHQNRKSTVIFPHGIYLDICGPSMSNLQEKSMPWVILEEAWRMDDKPGRIKEAQARTHDKWNAKLFLIGQAGETHQNPEDDDSMCELYRKWLDSDQRTMNFECPCCKTAQPYIWAQLKFDKIEHETGGVDWQSTEKTIRYECINPECDHVFHDTTKERRAMASSLIGRQQYRPLNPTPKRGCVGFHCNCLAIWRIPWLKFVMEWDEAMDALSRGDKSLLKVFTQKRLCEFWKPDAHEEKHELQQGGYKIADYENGELVDEEAGRCIIADVQQASLWFGVGAWTSSGRCSVLNVGEILSFDDLETIRVKYKVRPQCVLVDSQYRRDFVFQQCSKYGWTAFRGIERDDFFPIHLPNGTIVKAPYSKVTPVVASGGKKANLISFMVNPLKDTLAELRAGRNGELVAPDDISADFIKHLNAEVRRRVPVGIKKTIKEIWIRIAKRPNHLLDVMMGMVGFAMVKGWISLPETKPEIPHNEAPEIPE